MARKLSRQGERALRAANELARQGLEATGEARLALAREALALSPLCAGAHKLLALAAEEHSDAAMAHWRRAVSAGATAIGPAGFRDLAAGWEGPEHLGVYIDALQALARAHWVRGERIEAIEALTRAMRFDPEDAFVLRFTLIGWLLAEGDDAGAGALLATDAAPEDEAEWAWVALLLAFRTDGDTEDTRAMLRESVGINDAIALVLIRGAVPDDAWPPGTSPQDPVRFAFDEAELVLDSLGEAWRVTPGALAWLETTLDGLREA